MTRELRQDLADLDYRLPLWVCLAFIVCHGGLFLFDLMTPDAFMAGDRAGSRIDKIYALFGAYLGPHTANVEAFVLPPDLTFTERLITLAAPGDYIIHGFLYLIGGQYFVILVQVCLMFCAVVALYRLALLAGLTGGLAALVAVVYMLLPSSLLAPHTLATEALFSPLSTIFMYLLVSATDRELRPSVLYFALVIISVCIFTRLQLLFFPFVIAAAFLLFDRTRAIRTVPPTLILPFLLPAAWIIFSSLFGTGTEGAADNSVLLEFFKITRRAAAVGGFAFDPSLYPDERMAPGDFLGYFLAHPFTYLKLKGTDVVNMLVNPGVNSFCGRYLGLFGSDAGESVIGYRGYWRDLRDQAGLAGVLRGIIDMGPAFAIAFIGGTALWSAVLLGAVIGVWRFVRRATLRAASLAILLIYPLYTVAILMSANTNRWDHRSPFDFLVALLFGFGVATLFARRQTPAAVAT